MTFLGLTSEEVKSREDSGQINKVSKKYSNTYLEIFLRNIVTFFNILLTALFIILLVVKTTITNCFFMLTVLANTGIGIIQEFRSKYITDKLSLLSEGKVKAIRDGKENTITSSKIVKDDIIILEVGNEIPIDGEILEGQIEINESLLTGESKPIKKTIGDKVLAGTYIVSGTATIKAEKVGNETYAAGLQKVAKEVKGNNSELFRSLNRIIKTISIIIIPVVCLLFASQYINNKDLEEVISNTAGSAIGMIPAGMVLLTSVALAVGVIRLAKKKVLSNNMYSIEMLARTDVLCFDKTGTLTDGTMKVQEVKEFLPQYNVKQIMGSYLNAMSDRNQTSLALQNYFAINSDLTYENILPFSSKRKYSAVEFRGVGTFFLGAPDILLQEKQANKEIFDICLEKQEEGYRVLLLGITNEKINPEERPKKLKTVALFVIADHVREEVKPMLQWFAENNVEVKIISGDNVATVATISKIAGVPNWKKYISLDGLTDEEVKEAALQYTVFGRVSPEQKALIVEALKEAGKTVTVSGDGVNDLIAMKKADCSIAMGNGSDAARNAANLVLLDNNFAMMDKIVAEGRRVVNNISRSSTLFLMKTFFTAFITILTIIMGFVKVSGMSNYPFSSGNILLFEWFVIGIPSFFLALQPNNKKIQGSFLQNIIARAFPAAITLILSVLAIMILQYFPEFGITPDNYNLMCVLCFTFAGGFTVFFKTCKKFNLYRIILFALCLAAAIASTLIIPLELFDITGKVEELNLLNWMTVAAIILLCVASYTGIKKFCQWLLSIRIEF